MMDNKRTVNYKLACFYIKFTLKFIFMHLISQYINGMFDIKKEERKKRDSVTLRITIK